MNRYHADDCIHTLAGVRLSNMHGYASSQRERCRTHRNGKPRKKVPRPARRSKIGEAKGRPSHIGRAGLRDDQLQHSTGNTRNTQVRCNKGKQLPTSKKGKFEHWFSNTVSSILHAKNLRTGIKCKDNEGTFIISFREENFELFCQHAPPRRKLLSDLPVFE